MRKRGQRKLDIQGLSRVSVLDVGLGVATGLGVPFATEEIISRVDSAPAWLRDNTKYVAMGVGVIAQIPVFAFRGLGPALIGGAMSLAYGIGPMLGSWLSELGSGEAAAGVLAPRTNAGRLQAARRRAVGRLQSAPQSRSRRAFAGAPQTAYAGVQGSAY